MEFLVLEIDGARFGVPTSDVREVVRAVRVEPPVGRFPNMLGMLNYRGNVVGVLELNGLRQRVRRNLIPQDHLIVLQASDQSFALRVDTAVEIMTWDVAAPDVDERAKNKTPMADHEKPISHPELGVVYLLDTDTLWSELYLEERRQPDQEVEVG